MYIVEQIMKEKERKEPRLTKERNKCSNNQKTILRLYCHYRSSTVGGFAGGAAALVGRDCWHRYIPVQGRLLETGEGVPAVAVTNMSIPSRGRGVVDLAIHRPGNLEAW